MKTTLPEVYTTQLPRNCGTQTTITDWGDKPWIPVEATRDLLSQAPNLFPKDEYEMVDMPAWMDPIIQRVLIYRKDYWWWWLPPALFKFKQRVKHFFIILKCKVIITLEVWGLADILEGMVPTWRDIKILRRIR